MVSNPTRKEYIEAAKAAFLKLAKKQVMKKLAAGTLGWFITGPLGPITAILIEKILVAAIEEGETRIFFVFIDFRVGDQENKFTQAALDNYRIQQNGTEDEKLKAEESLIKAFDDFVKFNRY